MSLISYSESNLKKLDDPMSALAFSRALENRIYTKRELITLCSRALDKARSEKIACANEMKDRMQFFVDDANGALQFVCGLDGKFSEIYLRSTLVDLATACLYKVL